MPDESASNDDDFPRLTWLLVRVLPGDPPGAIKMRHALKAMLRSYGLRLERITPAGEGKEPPVAPDIAARTTGTG